LPVSLIELLLSIVKNIMMVFSNICNKKFSSFDFSQMETNTRQKEKMRFNA